MMKADRTVMHRRAQRAEADRDKAVWERDYFRSEFARVVKWDRESREKAIAWEIDRFRRRVSARVMQGASLMLAFAVFLLLTACATPAVPISQPAPKATDARLCAKAEPEPQLAGSIVQPATDQEREATSAFLNYAAEVVSWGRRGWERAQIAAKGC